MSARIACECVKPSRTSIERVTCDSAVERTKVAGAVALAVLIVAAATASAGVGAVVAFPVPPQATRPKVRTIAGSFMGGI
jgi:hypothetical protein